MYNERNEKRVSWHGPVSDLEQYWEDAHTRLIGYIADELRPQLPDDLIARMEEKVYVEDAGERRVRKPDVWVVESPTDWQPASGPTAVGLLDEPILLKTTGDSIRQPSVLIYDSADNRIVTANKILSPCSKSPGKAVKEYLSKRDKYINSEMNLVDIDSVRAGYWPDMLSDVHVPEHY